MRKPLIFTAYSKLIMREIQFREAICEAMSEEMRRDESVLLLWEEITKYNGAYNASRTGLSYEYVF